MSQEVVHRWFIAVELGAEWPAWMTELVGASARRVVAQSDTESPEGFAERALGVAATTQDVRGVLLLCNERADTVQLEARRRLVGGASRRGWCRVARRLIAAPPRASARLKELLTSLGDGSSRRNGSIEVCFGAPEKKRPSVRPVARVA
jgi:hypothetical protein